MSHWYVVLPLTVCIIIFSAFFVIIEFSLLSARRHRLEEKAENSASARAGLRSLNELTIMLAGAQLGITAATFALGAITEPWLHHVLVELFGNFAFDGVVANVIAFALALFVVTFLHLVVGEMAPKSWAIANPETSLSMVSLPARAFVKVFRPLLSWINSTANWLVKLTGEEPINRAAAKGYDAEMLSQLVGHSLTSGALDADSAREVQEIIELESSNVGETFEESGSRADAIAANSTVLDVQNKAREHNYLRVLIENPASHIPDVVHVRDTVTVDPSTPARTLITTPLIARTSMPINALLDRMRERSEQLAVVIDESGTVLGVLTWDDIMNRLWPRIQEVTQA